MQSCVRVKELNLLQTSLIAKHIEKHKWYRHILTTQDGIANFITEYGGIIKDVFCECCPHHTICSVFLNEISCSGVN